MHTSAALWILMVQLGRESVRVAALKFSRDWCFLVVHGFSVLFTLLEHYTNKKDFRIVFSSHLVHG